LPVLHHDGLAIWDSIAIGEYLHELAPEAQLWPADRAAAPTPARSAPRCTRVSSRCAATCRWICASTRPGHVATPEALADLPPRVRIWRDALAASGGPFLFGSFTLADAMFAPVTTRFTTYGVELDATCRAYVNAIAALPAMAAWRKMLRPNRRGNDIAAAACRATRRWLAHPCVTTGSGRFAEPAPLGARPTSVVSSPMAEWREVELDRGGRGVVTRSEADVLAEEARNKHQSPLALL